MPQLIAMVIVVVGAMIYMFQTFGGTGDKIEGIAQKTSIVTEINNIRNGLQLAVRAGDITNDGTNVTVLQALANLGYFADQMNNEMANNTGAGIANTNTNTYSAISFGGEDNPGMLINLVVGDVNTRPGIRVELVGQLEGNRDFLETQLATDLEAIASIDRTSTTLTAVTLDANGNVPAGNRPATVAVPTGTAAGTATGTTLTDGIFTIYFKDMPANIVLP
jgi:hypothetical protein